MKELILEMEEYASLKNIPIIEKDSIAFIMNYIKKNNTKNCMDWYLCFNKENDDLRRW